jgi:hypothetical protein
MGRGPGLRRLPERVGSSEGLGLARVGGPKKRREPAVDEPVGGWHIEVAPITTAMNLRRGDGPVEMKIVLAVRRTDGLP